MWVECTSLASTAQTLPRVRAAPYGACRMKLEAIDANLLVAFDVLATERSVTRAARRLGLSQPAMSNTLGRLRKVFGDPLLVRRRGGMQPTRRALELVDPIHRALGEIRRTLDAPVAFEPGTSRSTFRVAATDYASLVVLPALTRRVRHTAPEVELEVLALGDGLPEEDLRAGRLDVAVGAFAPQRAGPLRHEELFDDGFVCIVRQGRLTFAEFLRRSHVRASPLGRACSMIDRRLAELGVERRVVLTTSHVLVAAMLAARTNLVATVGRRLAERSGLPRIRMKRLPFEVPAFTVSMVWHERTANDPSVCWLREELRAVGVGLRRASTRRERVSSTSRSVR